MTIKLRQRTYKSGRHGWQADIHTAPAGSRIRQRFRLQAPEHVTSRSGAQRWAEDQRREIETQGPPPTTRAGRQVAEVAAVEEARVEEARAAATVTFAEVLPQWLDEGRAARHSPGTLAVRERLMAEHVLPVLGDRPLGEISDADAAKLRRALVDLAPSTANTVIKTARAMVRTMAPILGLRPPVERWGSIKDDRPREARAYDPATFEEIVRAAEALGREHLAVVLLAGEGGLRRGEILGLQIGDLDGAQLHVRRQVIDDDRDLHVRAPKSSSARTVPLSERTARAAAAVADGRPAGAWLIERGGTHATPAVVKGLVDRALARAGVPQVGGHALRHTALSHTLAAGVDLRTVQEIAGHAAVTTTARYLHALPSQVRTAGDRVAAWRREAATVTDLALVPQRRRVRPKK